MKLQIDHEDVKGQAVVESHYDEDPHVLELPDFKEHSKNDEDTSDSDDDNEDEVDVVPADVQREICKEEDTEDLNSLFCIKPPFLLFPGNRNFEDALIDA